MSEHRQDPDPRKKTQRYPYTYAYDYLRMFGPQAGVVPLLGRSDCGHLLEAIATATGIGKVELAEKLADYYLEHEEELVEQVTERVARGMAGL
jgi:hypothetical protein